MIKLKYGDLIAFYPTSFFGEIVCIIDSKGLGSYSHWAVFTGYEKGVPMFIESNDKMGVVMLALKEWQNNFDIYRAKKLKPKLVSELYSMIGNKYGFNRIWSILLNRLFRFPLWGESPYEPICTELCNYAYHYRLAPAGQATPYTLEKSKELKCIYKSNTKI